MNGELAHIRAEQRAVTAFTLALLAAAVAVVALALWLLFDWWNFTVLMGTAVVGAIAVSVGDKVRHQAPSKGQAAVVVSVVALSLTVLHMLLLIASDI